MDFIEKILWLVLLVSLVCCSVTYAYGEKLDVYDTLRIKQERPPTVCVFEANPEITDNWENIEVVTYEAINEWKVALENESNLLFLPIYGTIPWSDHAEKKATDFPMCNILINYEESSGTEALGTTSIDFSKSWHKYMFINVYLNHYKSTINITLGETDAVVGTASTLKPLPLNSVKNIIMHEFGHALGLGHYHIAGAINGGVTPWKHSVMVPSIAPFDEELTMKIQPSDLEMIRQLYGKDGFISTYPIIIPSNCSFKDGQLIQCNS